MLRSNRSNDDSSMSNQSSARPMSITRPMGIGRPFNPSANPNQAFNSIAASAPVTSWVPPPAPSARPRLALVEPPPMELPPSPPVFSQMQMQAAAADVARFQQQGYNQPINQSNNQSLQPQKYSRSLSSSAPAHHIDYLSQFRPLNQSFNQPTNQLIDDDMDEKGISIHPAISHTIHQSNAAELSKSPTIFSILSEHTSSQQANQTNQTMNQAMYRRSSLVGQLIDEGDEEPEDDANRSNQSNDDLQFSINLDEGEEGEDQPSDLSLY